MTRATLFLLTMSIACGLTGCLSQGWHCDPRKPESISVAIMADDGLTTRAMLSYNGPAGLWSDRAITVSSSDTIAGDNPTTRTVTISTGTDSDNSRIMFLGLGALAVKAWESIAGVF